MLSGAQQPAVRWHGRQDVRLEQVDRPADPGPGMAKVAVSYCGICGTDVGEYREGPFMIRDAAHPLTGQAPPLTLGHEFSGRVVAVGSDVDVEPGTRVTADACWRCGRCEACVRGDYHLCRQGGSIGLHSDGAFAPEVLVPAYTLVSLPDAVDDDAAALSEPLAVALHALDRGQVHAADDVLVIGFGPIGAGVALLARAIGAEPWVVDVSAERCAIAEGLGFNVIEGGEELPRRQRAALARLGADVVFECTGVPALLETALRCADRGGRIVLVGLSKAPGEITSSLLALYERSLVGSLGYRGDIPRVVQMMSSGQLDPSGLISEVVPLSAVPAMLTTLSEEPGARIKVLARLDAEEETR